MLIVVFIIDYKFVMGYGKWLVDKVKINLLLGIGGILLMVFVFFLVSLFLLGKVLFKKKVWEVEQEVEWQWEGEYVDFEEFDSEFMDFK